jgi:hypothetical protein
VSRPFRIAVLALVPALGACAGRTPARTAAGAAELKQDEILVRVTNTYHGIVDVYAVGSGLVDRLGTVSVGSPSTFRVRLRQFPPASQIQIVARPLGGRNGANSGPLSLWGGEVVEFSVNANLFGSVLIR